MVGKAPSRLDIREIAENDLEAFIRLVHPRTLLGSVHKDVISWWTKGEAPSHSLLLLPRDHQKSRLAAYRAAWEITKNPAIRILYVSSTSPLAIKQLGFIKGILESPIYRKYWPEMINEDVGQRKKWTETEIVVDHPLRVDEAVRDPTIWAAGLTTSTTGFHCDIAFLDDLVTPENAYTETGRDQVKIKHGQFASIEGVEGKECVVGTRYHPADLYGGLMNKTVDIYDEDGNLVSSDQLYDVFERVVEDSPSSDGTGNYLWPRVQRSDGQWFGFNQQALAVKRAQYDNPSQFRAQYYNDPNDTANAPISSDYFQYYDPHRLKRFDGKWFFEGRRLNVFAAVDFAFSLRKKADFTSIVVVGIDDQNNIFVLDIDRFKTDKISDYFNRILALHQKWDFRKLKAEVTAAQKVIVKDLKENYIRRHGLVLMIDDHKPTRHEGTKEERINAALQPRYANGQMFHPKGHNLVEVLEAELVLERPPHDDIKDCLASVMDMLIAPSPSFGRVSRMPSPREQLYNNRFGGIL